MLWYKGWLETRFRLLFALGCTGLVLFQLHLIPPDGKSKIFGILENLTPIILLMICAMLSGAGIVTQAPFQAKKGLQASTIFTLSLPVSRLRLLAVRAGLGWLEAAGAIGALCCAMWLISPALRMMTTPVEMLEYAGTLIACASAIYFLSVLLATFLDDVWRIWGTMIGVAAFWWISSHTPLPAFTNIFRAMGKSSPLIAHTTPWNAIAFSVALSAILLFAALRVVQAREY